MDKPEKDDIALWQSNPVTKYFMAIASENLEDIKDGWASGDYISEDALTTVQSNSNAQGTAHALIALIAEMEGLADD